MHHTHIYQLSIQIQMNTASAHSSYSLLHKSSFLLKKRKTFQGIQKCISTHSHKHTYTRAHLQAHEDDGGKQLFNLLHISNTPYISIISFRFFLFFVCECVYVRMRALFFTVQYLICIAAAAVGVVDDAFRLPSLEKR